ncbi:MAG: MspA family porin, partial [Gordonia sp. (in: high G+C Gram-positive bacteria)]
ELKLNAGVNAKIAPTVNISPGGGGGSVGEIGAEAGAEATIIPAADLEFEVGAGKVQSVTLAEIAMTRPTADIILSNIQLSMSNALGTVQVRPYAKISVTTDTGIYVFTEYGRQRSI